MGKERILWIDALKAFAILIVILGHCLQFIGATGLLYKYIYAFHMPLFMAISGYCSYKQSVTFTIVKKRFLQLVVPFLGWPMVWYIIKLDFSGIINYYANLPINPDKGLWFLYVLFLIIMVEFFRSKVTKLINRYLKISSFVRNGYELGVVCVTLFLFVLYFLYKYYDFSGNWLNFVTLYYPYYMFGCLMRKHNERLIKHIDWIGLLGLLFFIIATYISESIILQPLIAVSGILGSISIFHKCCNRKMPQVIKFTGMSTLGIYAVHQPVIQYVRHIYSDSVWIDVSLSFILAYLISIVIVWLLKTTKVTRSVLLGTN